MTEQILRMAHENHKLTGYYSKMTYYYSEMTDENHKMTNKKTKND
jgi:hypothetical protein